MNRKTTMYPLFQCFNKYMKMLMNLSIYNSEICHFYSMYIVNFQPTDLNRFIKNYLYEIVMKMANLLNENNKSNSRINFISISKGSSLIEKVSKNYNDDNSYSIILFFYELLAFFKNNLPITVLSIICQLEDIFK